MNFSYGIIAAMGVLVASILVLIAADPDYVIQPPELEIVEVPKTPMTATVSLPMGSSLPGCEATDECFIPYNVSVGVGGTITWSNDDSAAHTVTSGIVEKGHDGLFDSGLFMAGTTYDFTFDRMGEYDYYCIVHPWMTGKVTVL